jgi:hypothetical protein
MTTSPDMIRVVHQTGAHPDCSVAALATFASVTYAQALAAFTNPSLVLKRGAHWREVRAAAKRLGLKTALKRSYDIDEDTGLLYLASLKPKDDDHMVFLWAGRVMDHEQAWLNPSAYLAANGFRPESLLVVVE